MDYVQNLEAQYKNERAEAQQDEIEMKQLDEALSLSRNHDLQASRSEGTHS